jgi:pimeloyl-ACP methyl ester carboxylesterase
VLDKFGVIFVAAAGSGNAANAVGRREPLAVIAEQNLAQRYALDPGRIYVGGFSGGSHVALHLALGYPDIFRGAMLDAGADPIGDTATPLPPRDLFAAFQASTRLIYVTGEKDSERRAMATDSVASMRHWCVFDLRDDLIPNAGHVVADAAALARTLQALDAPAHSDTRKLAACQTALEAELSGALGRIRALISAGKRDDARRLLLRLDARFGGLAAPDSVDLAAQ